jgi:excisionase family DNA binding protein
MSTHRLHTPADAAEILTVPESWLRKKAAARVIPCTFLGKHLRFSDEDIDAIVRSGARGPSALRGRDVVGPGPRRPPSTARRRGPGRRPSRKEGG